MSTRTEVGAQVDEEQSVNEMAYEFGRKKGLKIVDTPKLKNANYTVNIITENGNISPEAHYIALKKGNHSESYTPDFYLAEKMNVIETLVDKGILLENGNDYDLNPELPEMMLEYAQAASITGVCDEINLEDTKLSVYDWEKPEESTEWFEEFGRDVISYLDEADRSKAMSREISAEIDLKPKQIGFIFKKLGERFEENFVYSRSNGINKYDIEAIQDSLDLEKIVSEGWEAKIDHEN